jgi:hypothetical protein
MLFWAIFFARSKIHICQGLPTLTALLFNVFDERMIKSLILSRNIVGTASSRLMQISLVRNLLLRFFKTFQKHLAYAFLYLLG